MKIAGALALIFIFCPPGTAQMLNNSQVGDHYKIITFEKNENPQNLLVVYTKLDKNCQFVKNDGFPVVDFYWLMDRTRYKRTHPLIKRAIRKRLELSNIGNQEFELKVNDLKELDAKIDHPHLIVKVKNNDEGCQVVSYFPDDHNQGKLIAVSSIYSESRKTFLPPFRKLLAITIRGTASGEAVQRTYVAR